MIISTHSLFLHSWEIKAGVGRSGNEKYIGGWYLPVGKRVYYVVWQRLKRNEKDFCHYQLADFLYCRDAYQKWCVTDTCTLGMYSSKTKKGDWIATHVQCHVLIIIQRSLETIPCIYVNNGLECSGFSVSLRNISYSYAHGSAFSTPLKTAKLTQDRSHDDILCPSFFYIIRHQTT